MPAPKNDTVVTSDIVRAWANAMDNGFTGSVIEFAASEEGQAATTALADQKAAQEKSQRLANARAVSRDIRDNGEVTSYSKDRAMQMRDYLAGVDFDAIKADAS